MPKGKNCSNCGAVYEIDKNKCPYCGTSYFDMSFVDFTNGTPFYVKVKTEMNGYEMYITQLVRPSLVSMTFERDTVDTVGRYGEKLCSFVESNTLSTNIMFTAIPGKNGSLVQIEIEKEKAIK